MLRNIVPTPSWLIATWAAFTVMRIPIRLSITAIIVTISTPLVPALSVRAADTAETWVRWEHALTSTVPYDNPYAEVTLKVDYQGPSGELIHGFGFWDGGDTFRIRCAFPTVGTWHWQTFCSDKANAGLDGQAGISINGWTEWIE